MNRSTRCSRSTPRLVSSGRMGAFRTTRDRTGFRMPPLTLSRGCRSCLDAEDVHRREHLADDRHGLDPLGAGLGALHRGALEYVRDRTGVDLVVLEDRQDLEVLLDLDARLREALSASSSWSRAASSAGAGPPRDTPRRTWGACSPRGRAAPALAPGALLDVGCRRLPALALQNFAAPAISCPSSLPSSLKYPQDPHEACVHFADQA